MKIDKEFVRSYPFTIRPLAVAEGGGFAIEYLDLPGCISDGRLRKSRCDMARML